MAIKLQDKPNTVTPNVTYPFGNIRDDDGTGNGTPINTLVHADFHQFFAKILSESGITANGLVENATNGFQYFDAVRRLPTTETTDAWDNIQTTGNWTKTNNSTSTNSPDSAVSYFNIIVLNSHNSTVNQIALHPSTNVIYSRFLFVGVWSSWAALATQSYVSTAVSSEASDRAAADTSLSSDISSEASDRSNADIILQNNIDAINTAWTVVILSASDITINSSSTTVTSISSGTFKYRTVIGKIEIDIDVRGIVGSGSTTEVLVPSAIRPQVLSYLGDMQRLVNGQSDNGGARPIPVTVIYINSRTALSFDLTGLGTGAIKLSSQFYVTI